MGGRVTRYPMRGTETTDDKGHLRDIELGHRWMDAMSVDYSCLFPTGMSALPRRAGLGGRRLRPPLHPQF